MVRIVLERVLASGARFGFGKAFKLGCGNALEFWIDAFTGRRAGKPQRELWWN